MLLCATSRRHKIRKTSLMESFDENIMSVFKTQLFNDFQEITHNNVETN